MTDIVTGQDFGGVCCWYRNISKLNSRKPRNSYEQLIYEGTMASYEENKYRTLALFNKAIQMKPRIYVGYMKRAIEFSNAQATHRSIDDLKIALHCVKEYPLEQPYYCENEQEEEGDTDADVNVDEQQTEQQQKQQQQQQTRQQRQEQHEKQIELILNGLISEFSGQMEKAKALYTQACSLHEYRSETFLNLDGEMESEIRTFIENCKTSYGVEDLTREDEELLVADYKRNRLLDLEARRIDEFEDDEYTSYAYFSLGFAQCSLIDFEGAIASYRKSIAFGPTFSDCIHYNNLAFCTENVGKKDEAYEYYMRGYSSYDKCLKCIYNIAKILNMEYSKYDEALKMLDKVFALDPSHAEAWVERGEIHMNQSQIKEAEDCFNKAIRMDPTSSYAYVRLASAKLYHIVDQCRSDIEAEAEAQVLAQWDQIVNTIVEQGKRNMITDGELLKFYIFEKVMASTLNFDIDGTDESQLDTPLFSWEQSELMKYLDPKYRIFPPEVASVCEFKKSLLLRRTIGSNERITTIARSPNTPNTNYEYYFDQYSTVYETFVDVEFFFQS